MENEIELKIMLLPENITLLTDWFNQQTILHSETNNLDNTYYDSDDRYFAKNKMGLRVRTKNNKHEITLKMKGDIVGGLHIRPEYNLALDTHQPDFKRLVSHYNLQFEDNSILDKPLLPTFSTDFTRTQWLIRFQQSEIEIALDQGLIKNSQGEEAICEIEFELKSGNLSDLIDLLLEMPKKDGMWLSSLSKAQRGYLVGNKEKIAKEMAKLTACKAEFTDIEKYQLTQQVADFIRLTQDSSLIDYYQHLTQTTLENIDYLTTRHYLEQNILLIKKYYDNSL
ncbi:adenylate cyclase [Pasteurellaceae bacterium Orientalotternb1]|nr:adenylate cyclase [Pasteurellaceae bacterium Orientalotternb1]